MSTGSVGSYRQTSSPSNSVTPPPSSPSRYDVDPTIAKTWSGGAGAEVNRSWSGDQEIRQSWSGGYDYDARPAPLPGDGSPQRSGGYMPRPQIVKRDTSHQNENYETKPSVKRAALNRDNSLASNRLKAEYMPEFYNGKFDTEREMRMLSDNLEQSTLNADMVRPRPHAFRDNERVTTLEYITADLMAKPTPLLDSNRSR